MNNVLELPWEWRGTRTTGYYLAAIGRGGVEHIVMGFCRMGTRRAQPFWVVDGNFVKGQDLCRFEVCTDATSKDDHRVYREDIIGFRCPEADLIAAAPELLQALKALSTWVASRPVGGEDYKAACDLLLQSEVAIDNAEGKRWRDVLRV